MSSIRKSGRVRESIWQSIACITVLFWLANIHPQSMPLTQLRWWKVTPRYAIQLNDVNQCTSLSGVLASSTSTPGDQWRRKHKTAATTTKKCLFRENGRRTGSISPPAQKLWSLSDGQAPPLPLHKHRSSVLWVMGRTHPPTLQELWSLMVRLGVISTLRDCKALWSLTLLLGENVQIFFPPDKWPGVQAFPLFGKEVASEHKWLLVRPIYWNLEVPNVFFFPGHNV